MTAIAQPTSDFRLDRRARRPRRALPLIASIGIVLLLAACSSGSTSSRGGSSAGTSGGTTNTHDAIAIRNFAFSPRSITVAPGATVTVTNDDQVTHTLTGTTGGFATGDIPAGQSKSFTAPKSSGMYAYMCSIHQFMSGMLVVSG